MATAVKSAAYAVPGDPGSPVDLLPRYDNFIGGAWVPPTTGDYRDNLTPRTGRPFTAVANSAPADIEAALDAAHAAKDAWGDRSTTERSAVLNKVADAIEENLEMLAVAESYDNGKPVRETLAADVPLAVDHFRYFADVIRAEEGVISEIDKHTVAYHFREPLGVVGQIIPFNFPLLMAAWKIAPALAAGNCTVLKPASPTPWSILKLAEVIGDIVPPGVLNIVNGPGGEIGKALATSKRISKIAFTGETVTGRLIMQYAAQNIIPSTTELDDIFVRHDTSRLLGNGAANLSVGTVCDARGVHARPDWHRRSVDGRRDGCCPEADKSEVCAGVFFAGPCGSHAAWPYWASVGGLPGACVFRWLQGNIAVFAGLCLHDSGRIRVCDFAGAARRERRQCSGSLLQDA